MTCVDYDECKAGAHECHPNAECINSRGSYRCCCLKGYHGNGKECRKGLCYFVYLISQIVLS